MSYRLIYTVPFASLENIPCVVEIEKENYFGEITELQGGSSPFTVDIADEDFLYIPTRFSTAKISIVGSDYLQSLFSTAYQQYRVTFKKNGVVTWCGFIKPELYTQDYSSETFELELECMSAMSSLEFIDYKQDGENRKFVSLWSILKKCISAALGQYTAVYIPHVYAKNKTDYDMQLNILEHLTVSEQDFFDEDDKPMKLKEVLEEVCKFLNWTCVDWKGELYFVDIDHSGEFYKYSSDLYSKTGNVSPAFINIQKKDYTGKDNTLDILPGCNKVTIRCSNYPVGELVLDEDFESLKQLNTIDNSTGARSSRRIFLSPNRWNMYLYDGDEVIGNGEIENYKDRARSLEGAILMKCCAYNQHQNAGGEWIPDITDYSFSNAIQIRYPEKAHNPITRDLTKVMSFKGPSAIYADSAISISYLLKSSADSDLGILDNSRATPNGLIYFQVRIGDSYFGSIYGTDPEWQKKPNYVFAVNLDSKNNDRSQDYISVKNQKTLSMPYSGINGFIIPIDQPLYGEFEFTMFCPKVDYDSHVYPEPFRGIILKDFKVNSKKKDGIEEDNSNSDRIYENIINENYINELDEIEFKISSYNKDGACYSKVMISEDYLTDNLYSSIEATTVRPEELLIRRIIKRYNATRIKLTQVIKASSDITPLSRLYDNYMVNKKFINAGGTIDYKMNQFQCIMIEV